MISSPALKRRAKFMPTLRVEDTCSEPPKHCRPLRGLASSFGQSPGVPLRFTPDFMLSPASQVVFVQRASALT